MARAPLTFIERALRALVRLLPGDFRYDFGPAIDADLSERQASGDRAGLLRRDLPSLIAAVVREHAGALRQDVKYALRTMRRTPGFTALAVLMLALGTGVNVAMFSVIDAVMLRSPFRDHDRLVEVYFFEKGRASAIPPDRFADLAAGPHPFAALAAYDFSAHILTDRGDPRSLPLECVSASMFDVLGTPPLLGRAFGPADDQPGAPATIVLGFDLWQELGGSTSVVGTRLTLNQTPVTVVGVMPRGFSGPLSRPRSRVAGWVPLGRPIAGGNETGCTSPFRVNAYARLQDGQTLESTQARLQGFGLVSLDDQTLERVRTPLLSLTAAVACVLLIACFNVGGLQMERMLARRREMALRLALGASRGRLVRQTLTENLMLGLAGAAAGLIATWFTLRAIVSLLPANLPHVNEIELNVRVLLAAVGAASAAGVMAGLFPIGQTRHVNPAADLAGRGRSSDRRGGWTRRGLVIAEVALSVIVLIGAALMIQTFLTLKPTHPGFDPSRKTIGLVRVPRVTPEAGQQFATDLLTRLKAAPGIRDAAAATILPMRDLTSSRTFVIGGTPASINTYGVTPGYFELMKIALRGGRTFTAEDAPGSAPVVIVNEAFAARLRPGGIAVGNWVPVKRRPADPPIERLIVGIVASTRVVARHTRTVEEAFVPLAQEPSARFFVIAESDGRADSAVAAELRGAVRALRPDLVVEELQTMTGMVESGLEHWRFGAWLLGILAALAVLLAAIGLMTTIGWWVRQRTRELGVRVALGAPRGEIMRLVLGQGLLLAGLGVSAGCLIAAGVTRYLEGWIYGVTPLDAATFAGSAAAMLVVAAAAVYVPVRRATSVDPVIALRSE